MILRTDDDIYVVDQRWYGPPGRELPFHVRYAAYGWGFVIYLLLMVVERVVLHLGLSFQAMAYTLLVTCFATTYAMRQVNPDRPFLMVLRGWWHELRSPRPRGGSGRARDARTAHRARLELVRCRAGLPPAFRGELASWAVTGEVST